MKVVIIASGSKGNCTYIETCNTKILIDAGISVTRVKQELLSHQIILDELDGIFITHEHSDHIGHLYNMLKKTKATLFIEEKTYEAAKRKLKVDLDQFPHYFIKHNHNDSFTKYELGDLSIVPLKLSHDTEVCLGYCIKDHTKDANVSFASITDTGVVNNRYMKILACMDTVLFESNYDEEMLINSGRPEELICRILSNHGHLSNVQSANYLKDFVNEKTKRIILGHISEECNDPDVAYHNVIDTFGGKIDFILDTAWQHESTYFTIGESND